MYTSRRMVFLAIVFFCSSTNFIAQQQACIQITVTIYTQACPHNSLFCFLLYQLSLWWVKYRAQPEKSLTPENTLAITHHDKQKHVEVKRSSRANPHEIRLFSGCPHYFTLLMHRHHHPFPAQLRNPAKKRRSFCVNMNHIIWSESRSERRKEGGRYRSPPLFSMVGTVRIFTPSYCLTAV